MKNVKVFLSAFVVILITILFIGCTAPVAEKDEKKDNNDNGGGGTIIPPLPIGPAPVLLGTAGNYVILANSAISTTAGSAVTGDVGISPAAASSITGFSLVVDGTGTFSTSALITGRVYAANYSVPTPATLTAAILDVGVAYTDAAGRITPDFTDYYAGNIGGLTLVPGLYKWNTAVIIPADVTLNGGPDDVWIFQISGTLALSSGFNVILTGGAQAKNIFWQTTGAVTIGTTAHMEGIILSMTAITLNTGASIKGRLLAQTAVSLDASTVIYP